jgi:hypothetical protein
MLVDTAVVVGKLAGDAMLAVDRRPRVTTSWRRIVYGNRCRDVDGGLRMVELRDMRVLRCRY